MAFWKKDQNLITVNRKTFLYTVIVILALLALGWLLMYIVQRVVYNERRELLKLTTETAASIIERESKTQWKVADLISMTVKHQSSVNENFEENLALVNKQFDHSKDFIYVVDNTGQYYCGDGTHGRLTDGTHYSTERPDSLDFVGSLPHLKLSDAFHIYSIRLAEPLHVKTKQGWRDIVFINYAMDANELMLTLGSLFPGEINAFMTDANGVMLYKYFGINLLLEGANCINKLGQCRYPFNENPDELVRKFHSREPFSVLIEAKGMQYYFCVCPFKSNEMSLAFVVQADKINDLSQYPALAINIYVSLIILVLGFFIFSRRNVSLKRKAAMERLQEQTRVAEAMSMASKAKSDFLSSMSHDIRTPINGIMGVTTLALHACDDPKVTDYLHKIDATSHHLLSLINDVLDMARIESGKTTITPAVTDMRTVVENCHTIINGHLLDRKLEFVLDFEGTHTAVLADKLHLQQVLINLLGNAVKFTEDGGHIWFRCHEKECHGQRVVYHFEVEDTGCGITKEFQKNIFEPFTQESNAARTKYKGTGLGMAITKHLVGLMGGAIEVESEPGKGTLFRIEMAFDVTESLPHEIKVQEPSADARNLENIRILLVEDNDLNREIATDLLEMEGAIVDTAVDGLDAVEKFKTHSADYDCILMDIMMPRMNGLDATRKIRELESPASHIPVIAMTANAFEDDVKATLEAGMDAHLSKPIDMTQVIATIITCVRNQ